MLCEHVHIQHTHHPTKHTHLPGVPFSTTIHEMPPGPGAPVRHMTRYRSLTPPPLMKAFFAWAWVLEGG